MTMPEQHLEVFEPPLSPDLSEMITEDDRPVDSRFSERQFRLLPHILFTSWEQGKPFEALSDVGLFSNSQDKTPVVPDFMLLKDVEPRPVTEDKESRSIFTWLYGKVPDLVVEIVSNTKGGEETTKFDIYQRIRIPYYAIYDPFSQLGSRLLRVYQLEGCRYVEFANPRFIPQLGLGLTAWTGMFDEVEATWLRFLDEQGELLLTGGEKAEVEREKAEQERESACRERERALLAEEKAERLAQRLRELGLEP